MKTSLSHFLVVACICGMTTLSVCTTGCSCDRRSSSASSVGGDSVSPSDSTYRPASQAVYDRGYKAGLKIRQFEKDSREREQALIAAHALITELADSGLTQSANDYRAGVLSALRDTL